ncbi:hypothetical protein [Streptomyces sp. NPDC001787]|uniref:hypothetical protein n=1 Tax=Streptomyces sp. NPDC001787 TaxID=3154523 RepID=UPI0033233B8D
MNAYSYAHNNPLTKADPTGLRPDGPAGGNSYNDERWANDRGMTAGYTNKNGKWAWNQKPKKDPTSQKKYAAYKANPSHYMIDDKYAEEYADWAKDQAEKAEAERKRADAERRKEDGVIGSIMKGNWSNAASKFKETGAVRWIAGNADTIKTVVGIGALTACVVASAGVCLAAGGVVIAAGIGVDAASGAEMGSEYWQATAVTAGITLAGGVVGRWASGGGKWASGGWFKSPRITTRGPRHAAGRPRHATRTDLGPTANAYLQNGLLSIGSCDAPAKSGINAGYCS